MYRVTVVVVVGLSGHAEECRSVASDGEGEGKESKGMMCSDHRALSAERECTVVAMYRPQYSDRGADGARWKGEQTVGGQGSTVLDAARGRRRILCPHRCVVLIIMSSSSCHHPAFWVRATVQDVQGRSSSSCSCLVPLAHLADHTQQSPGSQRLADCTTQFKRSWHSDSKHQDLHGDI